MKVVSLQLLSLYNMEGEKATTEKEKITKMSKEYGEWEKKMDKFTKLCKITY